MQNEVNAYRVYLHHLSVITYHAVSAALSKTFSALSEPYAAPVSKLSLKMLNALSSVLLGLSKICRLYTTSKTQKLNDSTSSESCVIMKRGSRLRGGIG